MLLVSQKLYPMVARDVASEIRMIRFITLKSEILNSKSETI